MIRQQPITTEKEFYEVLSQLNAKERGETLYVQWHPDYEEDLHWPQVELLENFLWIHTNPNDSWYYIENGDARAWRLFPNLEERHLPWSEKEKENDY